MGHNKFISVKQMKRDNKKQDSIGDNVNHPKHYNFGRIEVITAIEDWNLDFHKGNAVKYVSRAGKKDPSKEIEDLQKAIWYLNRRIEFILSEGVK